MTRPLFVPILIVASLGVAACSERRGPRVTVLDLIKLSPRAVRRPAGADFPVAEHTCGSGTLAGVSVPVPSRLIFALQFPARARLVIAAALDGGGSAAAEFRIGISDRRTYETLRAERISAAACDDGWTDIDVDLSLYGGRQWSLFYRPDERSWELILGVAPLDGAAARAIWGVPRIESDARAARAYLERRPR